MKNFAEKVIVILALAAICILALLSLPKINPDLASSLGAGFATFFNGVWFAITVIFWLAVLIVAAGAFVKIKQMFNTQVVRDDKDGRATRAIIHKGELHQVTPQGVDANQMMQFQTTQMKQLWQMMATATTSMKNMAAYLEQYEVVDADEDEEYEEVEGTDPLRQIAPPRNAQNTMSVTDELEELLANVLEDFQIHAYVEPSATQVGPRVIQFRVVPMDVQGRRTRIEEITKREKDIQLALGATTIRILSPVPGTHHVGIEIPNPAPTPVTFADILESSEYRQAVTYSKLVFALGCDITGCIRFCDIEKAPHILIGGATNAGKSVLLNVLIASLLNNATPDDVRLLMVDPKVVELTPYNGIAHLLQPVVTNMDQVVSLLKRSVDEMERRYKIFAQVGVRKIAEYRKLRLSQPELENLPAWVIVIDEFADLMITQGTKKGEEKQNKVETIVCRLAQKARAIGIHLVIATQRPSVDVITGLIKANFPTRIALTTTAAVDSRTIIDMGGAERLLGNGDMLYVQADTGRPERIQGAYMTNDEIQSVIARALDGVQSPQVVGEPSDKVVYLPSRIATKQASETAEVPSFQEDDGSLRNESEMSRNGTRNGTRNEQEVALEAHLHAKMLEVMDFYRDHPDSNQTDCMKEVWRATPGDNNPWKLARREYAEVQRMINELARRGMGTQDTNLSSQAGEA